MTTAVVMSQKAFADIVTPHIRGLLRSRGLYDQDLGPLIGMTPPQISERMSGKTAWKAHELAAVAAVLDVTVDVLTARDEKTFREKLTPARYSLIPGQLRLELASSQPESAVSKHRQNGSPLLAVVKDSATLCDV